MAPEERRQAIVDATVVLLLDKGADLSTKEIAQAAGVAEGTIFRAFETKDEVIHAAVCAALRPDATLSEIAALPAAQSLQERVEDLLRLLMAEIHRTRSLLVHLTQNHDHAGFKPGRGPHHRGGHDARIRTMQATVTALEPYSAQLRVPARTAARVLTALAMASTLSVPDDEITPNPETMANVVLHGIAEGA